VVTVTKTRSVFGRSGANQTFFVGFRFRRVLIIRKAMMDDGQLLQQYRREGSEPAFGELVTRHIDVVYSAALRVAGGDSHLAQDVTQTVFMDLARKARSLPRDVVLAGWLYRHAWYTAAKMVRTERRRQTREQTAMEMRALDDNTGSPWDLIAPHLDEGLNQLSASDRDAIVLRFFKQQDFRVIGASLGVSEDAAQKRVSRALEKLRGVLSKRDVTLTATALASVLAAEAVTAAPVGLAISVTTTALAGAVTVGTGLSLTTMKIMAMTKLQIGVAGAILIAGIATPLVLQHQSLNRMREESNRMREENRSLQQQVSQMAQLAAQNQRLSNLLARAGNSQLPKQDQLSELLRLRGEATRLRADAQANAKPANPMLEMLKTPQGKEMMKAAMRSMSLVAVKSYAKLFADLNLTAEQTATLKDLIINKQMASAEMAATAMAGQADTAQLKEQAAQVNAEQAAIDEQIKQLLGDDNYARYQSYGKNLSERVTVTEFEDQLAGGPRAVSPDQDQQLISEMIEERQNFKFTTDYSDPSKFTGDIASYYTEDRLTQFQQELEQLNQRYLERAQGILLPEQLGAFQTSLTSQQARQAASLQIGAKLIAAKSAGK
jgi:RNA polymerase sigma factor (sigma-70 family)